MFNIAVTKPTLVKVISFVVGALALAAAQQWPALGPLIAFGLKVLGVSAMAAGRPTIVAKAPDVS